MAIFKPYISSESIKLVNSTLKSGHINEGKNVEVFENLISKELKIRNALALNSCTSALHMALLSCNIKEGDEVILPAQTFVATGTAILMCKAKPVFADINIGDGNISVNSIEKKISKKTKAIIVVHWGGYPCDMDEINELSNKYNLKVIEDAAHALGATYKNRPIGNISNFTCFSFQAIKHITTGDGGLISLKNSVDYKRCKKLRWFGIDRKKTKFNDLNVRNSEISELGYKYHMNNISAAIGIGNLKQFKKIQKKREKIAMLYKEGLKDIDGLLQLNYKKNRISSWWMYNFRVIERGKFIKMLKKNKIPYSAVNTRIDKNPLFGTEDKSLLNQNIFDKQQISLSTDPSLKIQVVKNYIKIIRGGW